jgi:hypothetical protein
MQRGVTWKCAGRLGAEAPSRPYHQTTCEGVAWWLPSSIPPPSSARDIQAWSAHGEAEKVSKAVSHLSCGMTAVQLGTHDAQDVFGEVGNRDRARTGISSSGWRSHP